MTLPTRVWIWVPVAGIALTVAFNGALILTARQVRPTRVEEHPYQASARIDDEKVRQAAFRQAGLRLATTITAGRLTLALEAPATTTLHGPATIALWRPDEPALDATIAWPDVATPIAVPLGRPGHWRLQLELPAAPGWPLGARSVTVVTW